jgi:energy-coupling factor transport system substrate-specific component
LDTIGTIFASMLCGPWVGALAGGLTNIINGIANPVNFAFIPVNVIVGIVTGFLARGNMFGVWWKWLISIILMTLASIISAAPIVVLMFGGVTGGGTSIIAATLMAAGTNIWIAVIGSDGVFTVIDRSISYFISWFVIKVIPNKTLIKFGCGGNYIKKKTDSAAAGENSAGEP